MKNLAGIIARCETDESLDLDEAVNALAIENGWCNVIKEEYRILTSYGNAGLWYPAASVISWAAEEGIPMPISHKEIIVRLYWCLRKCKNLGMSSSVDAENLVWSTVCTLGNIAYTSDWDPMKEPEIVEMVKTFG